MSVEHRPQFILKRHFAIVFCLVLNVLPDFLNIGLTDRKTSLFALPLKVFVASAFARLHPLRAAVVDLFNNLLEGMVLRQRKRCVHVIFDTADRERGALPFYEYASLVCEETVTYVLGNPQTAVFGAVDKVD